MGADRFTAGLRVPASSPGGMPAGEMMPGGEGGMPGGEMGPPPGDPLGGGSAPSAEKFRCTEGLWSFVLTVTGEGEEAVRMVTVTGWDKATAGDVDTIIVPAYLGGGTVTAIASTAFSAAGSVRAVYLPDTVEEIAEFAFYDLNNLQYISCANPEVNIRGQALASCNSQSIQTNGTPVSVAVESSAAAVMAGGSYLNGSNDYAITEQDIAAIAQGDYTLQNGTLVFQGAPYTAVDTTKPVVIADALKDAVSENDFRYTFRNLTDEAEAAAFQESISEGAFGTVQLGLDYAPGYYLNGTKVLLEENCKAIDAATGEELLGPISTGMTYTYAAYRDADNNGKIDTFYYTDGISSFVSAPLDQDTVVSWPGTLTDGKGSASSITGSYLAFANGVLESDGAADVQTYDSLTVTDTANAEITLNGQAQKADAVMASLNRERSVLWANDYGKIEVRHLNAVSSSSANWAQETFEAGDANYNYELNMQYGLNAGLYATNGGQISVGSLEGEASYLETCGDTGNGVIAIGGGSAGAYVIGQGSGTIKAMNTNFTSNLDSGLCTAGGEFDITGGTVTGIIGFRARANGVDSTLSGVHLVKSDVWTNYADYVTDRNGGIAASAALAWAEATGDNGMPDAACSNLLVGQKGMTIGTLCDAYQVESGARQKLYDTLSQLTGETYTDETLWRGSALDSDRYGHPIAGTRKIVKVGTDYSEAPYLNAGVGAEGLQTSAIIEYQGAQLGVTLNDCTVAYEGSGDYNYLIASESAACAEVTFQDCDGLTGIIWNEGDKNSASTGGINLGNSDMGGMGGADSAYGVIVDFRNSSFTGSFADGDYGLWDVDDSFDVSTGTKLETLTPGAYEHVAFLVQAPGKFADDNGQGTWNQAGEAIYAAVDAGIIGGYADGTFRPDRELTLGETAKLVACAAGIYDAGAECGTIPANHWAKAYLASCVNAGLLNADSAGSPDRSVTRAEFAGLLAQAGGAGASALLGASDPNAAILRGEAAGMLFRVWLSGNL